MMDRRRFLLGSLAGVLAPRPAKAQATRRIPRVGIVAATSPPAARHQVDAFRDALRELGNVEGQRIVVEERWAQGQLEQFTQLISDLQRSKVDVIVVASAAGAWAATDVVTATPARTWRTA